MKLETEKLFSKDFTLLVIGQVISLFGNAILRFALPLYLLRETGSATLFGIVTAISFAPTIVLSLIGGVLADRVNKRNIMVILDFSTALLISICYLFLAEVPSVPIVPLFIIVLMLLYGISGTYQPVVQASIPVLLSGEKLMLGNAVINQVSTLSYLLGPVIGGMVFGLFGLFPILLISILCFTFSAIMELFINIPHISRQAREQEGQREQGRRGIFEVVDDLREAYIFVKRDKPILLSVAYVVSAFNLVLTSFIIIGIPILVVQTLDMSDAMLGFAQGFAGLGGLLGGFLVAILRKKLNLQNLHLLLIICALCVAIMGLSLKVSLFLNLPSMVPYGTISLMSFIIMGVATLFTVQIFTMVQQETPPQFLGKIMAALISVAMCAQPLGQTIYGILFDVFHDSSWLILLVAASISFCIALYSKRIFRKLEN